MWKYVKENLESLCLVISLALSIAYGLSGFMDMSKAIAVLVPISLILFYFFNRPDQVESNIDVEDIMSDFQAILDEQEKVILDYENIFDLQLVELPCVCGGNTFQGLFSPKTDNVVECEKCNNKYRVEISYNSVLISEPLDINQTFDNLVGEIN